MDGVRLTDGVRLSESSFLDNISFCLHFEARSLYVTQAALELFQ